MSVKLKLKKGDTVIVKAGDDKGKTGVIKSIDMKSMRLIVEGINIHKKHTKPSAAHPERGIVDIELGVHISNLAYFDGTAISKVGRKIEGDRLVRVARKTGNIIK